MQHNIITKILKEATYENDMQTDKFINNIIDEIKQSFKNYNGQNTDSFTYNSTKQLVVFDTKRYGRRMLIVFYDKYSDEAERESGGYHMYVKPDNIIKIFGCSIDWEQDDEKKGHWFDLNFQESTLYHELVHLFDINFKNAKIQSKPKDGEVYKTYNGNAKKYFNHGLEFNAYFLQEIMPEFNKLKNLVKNNKLSNDLTFQKFFNELLKNEEIKNTFDFLNKEMKRHYIKRLAEYFQKITNGIN